MQIRAYEETWTDMGRCFRPQEVITIYFDCSGFVHKGVCSREKVSADTTAEKLLTIFCAGTKSADLQ